MARAFRVVLLATLAAGCGGKSDINGSATSPVTACEKNSDCVVIPESCCGQCGAATRGDARAVNRDHLSDARSSCSAMACPACYAPNDPELVATCEAGVCQLVDLQDHSSTACSADADCRVRVASCCECGGSTAPGTLIAVSREPDFSNLVCDVGQACAECAPVYPLGVVAACQSGHCAAVDPRR